MYFFVVIFVAQVFSFISKSLLPQEGPENLCTDWCGFLKMMKDAAVRGEVGEWYMGAHCICSL